MGNNRSGDTSLSGISGSVVVIGNENRVTQTHTTTASSAADASVDIKAELAQFRHVLESLVEQRDAQRLNNAVAEAENEAAQEQPRKEVIGESLERALKIVTSAGALGDAVTKLRPIVERLTSWLGVGFTSLLKFVGA